MKRFWLASSLLALAPTFAVQPVNLSEYSVPLSGLRLAERSDGGNKGHFATFKGRITLTGTLAIAFDRSPEMTDAQDTEGAAYFLPDKSSRSSLPHAVGNFYPREVDKIELDKKPAELLSMFLGSKKTMQVLRGNMPRYEFPAEITITEFTAWIECDHRGYSAVVAKIRSPKPVMLSKSEGGLLGC